MSDTAEIKRLMRVVRKKYAAVPWDRFWGYLPQARMTFVSYTTFLMDKRMRIAVRAELAGKYNAQKASEKARNSDKTEHALELEFSQWEGEKSWNRTKLLTIRTVPGEPLYAYLRKLFGELDELFGYRRKAENAILRKGVVLRRLGLANVVTGLIRDLSEGDPKTAVANLRERNYRLRRDYSNCPN